MSPTPSPSDSAGPLPESPASMPTPLELAMRVLWRAAGGEAVALGEGEAQLLYAEIIGLRQERWRLRRTLELASPEENKRLRRALADSKAEANRVRARRDFWKRMAKDYCHDAAERALWPRG